MHRGKGMKFVGDSRVSAPSNENKYSERLLRIPW